MPPEPKYNQTIPQVVESLAKELAGHRDDPNQQELVDVDPDTAFVLGYETAVHDLKRFTGPDPVEMGLITYTELENTDD